MKHSHIVSYHVIVISRHSIACTLSHTLSAQAYARIVSGHDADACKEARTHADAGKEARTHAAYLGIGAGRRVVSMHAAARGRAGAREG